MDSIRIEEINLKIGKRIYYDKETGNVIVDTGERQGSVVPTTIEQDIKVFKELSSRNRNTFDVIELEFGQYSRDFAECYSYRVDPTTKKLEFSYPDLSKPGEEPKYAPPLSEDVKALKEDVEAVAEMSTISYMDALDTAEALAMVMEELMNVKMELLTLKGEL